MCPNFWKGHTNFALERTDSNEVNFNIKALKLWPRSVAYELLLPKLFFITSCALGTSAKEPEEYRPKLPADVDPKLMKFIDSSGKCQL